MVRLLAADLADSPQNNVFVSLRRRRRRARPHVRRRRTGPRTAPTHSRLQPRRPARTCRRRRRPRALAPTWGRPRSWTAFASPIAVAGWLLKVTGGSRAERLAWGRSAPLARAQPQPCGCKTAWCGVGARRTLRLPATWVSRWTKRPHASGTIAGVAAVEPLA